MEKEETETNIIYCGDSKDILKKLPENSVDLIYLDPPFFSQKHYENFWDVGKKDNPIKTQFSDKEWEKLRKSIQPNILKIYEHIEERWKGGKSKGIYVYIAYMRERLEQCWRVLKPTGSIYLHCDWHAGHYLKMMMDEVFGYNNFLREIIWSIGTSSGFKSQANMWIRGHDTLLYYKKGEKYTFNKQFFPLDEKTIKRYDKIDKNLRKYKIYYDSKGEKRIVYLDKSKGRPLTDVWTDIIGFQTVQKKGEYLGYPTQKPELLLERIIKTSSNEGNIVLDPFCGCGTTLEVAKKLNRKFIGIDISRTACYVMKKRLGSNLKIVGGETLEEVKKMNPHDVAQLIIVEKWDGIINPKKSGDMGIDGWVEFMTIPVQVKNWSHKVGRPEIDKFKTAVERDHKIKGIIVAEDFSKDCYAEVSRIKSQHKIDIRLFKFESIFESHNHSNHHHHEREDINHPAFMIL